MKVTSVEIIKVDRIDQPTLKAYATIMLDGSLLIHNIRVVEGRDGLFASMPSRRRKNGSFQNLVHPVNAELREHIEMAIFEEYDKIPSEESSNEEIVNEDK